MSLQRHGDAVLSGWGGPFYPILTDRLAETLVALPGGQHNGASLAADLRRVSGFVVMSRPQAAAHGYTWFWAVEFAVHGGRVLVAFPSEKRRNELERAPAAYTQGIHVNIEAANVVVSRVIRALRPNPGRRPILQGP